MNGQKPSSPPPLTPRASGPMPMAEDEEASHSARKLAACVFLSSLLHLAILCLPYLGQSREATRSEIYGQRKQSVVLSARFSAPRPTLLDTPKPAETTSVTSEGQPTSASAPKHEPKTTETSIQKAAPAEEKQDQEAHEGADLLPIPAPVFYPAEQLSKKPQPTMATDLEAPEVTPLIASGRIILKLWISDLGEVVEVQIEKTNMPLAFSRVAIAGFKRLRFTPGLRDGHPVGSTMRIEVTYDDGRMPPP